MSLNRVMLLGRLTKDPELKHTPTGTAVINFTVATSMKWKKDGGTPQEKSEFHNVVAWQKLAELAGQYLSKGSQTYVEGRLETRSWEDKDGKKRYTTEIIAEKIEFIGDNKKQNETLKEMHNSQGEMQIASNTDFAADSIPF